MRHIKDWLRMLSDVSIFVLLCFASSWMEWQGGTDKDYGPREESGGEICKR